MPANQSGIDPGTPTLMELRGTLHLFGFPPGAVLLRVHPRSPGWRGIRAAFFLGGGLILAPVVGIIPPHAPWVAGVLGFGGWLGIRKWREHFTLESIEGICPKCGEPLSLRAGIPLRQGMSVPCDRCHHEARLTVVLPSASPAAHPPSGSTSPDPDPGNPASGMGEDR